MGEYICGFGKIWWKGHGEQMTKTDRDDLYENLFDIGNHIAFYVYAYCR